MKINENFPFKKCSICKKWFRNLPRHEAIFHNRNKKLKRIKCKICNNLGQSDNKENICITCNEKIKLKLKDEKETKC